MREPLKKNVLVQAAVGLIEREGLEKLSMRRLGKELGVQAMSLYNHVDNKADLLDAVHANLLGKLPKPEPNLSWEDSVRQIARGFRDLLVARPTLIPLFTSRSAIAPESLGFLDSCIGTLISSGFESKQALHIFQVSFSYVLGHAQIYFCERSPDSLSGGRGYQNYPYLSQLPDLDPHFVQEEFEMALECLIAGFAASLSAP